VNDQVTIRKIILRNGFANQVGHSENQLEITEGGRHLNQDLLNDVANFYDGFSIMGKPFENLNSEQLIDWERYFKSNLEFQEKLVENMRGLWNQGRDTIGISPNSFSYENAQVDFIKSRIFQIQEEIKIRSMETKQTVINATNSNVAVVSNSPNATVNQKITTKVESETIVPLLNSILDKLEVQHNAERELVLEMLRMISDGVQPDKSYYDRLLSMSANVTTIATAVVQVVKASGFFG
jgi:hypothetical protein